MKEKEYDYLNVLKALKEIPFSVGRTLLIEFLQGDETNESIIKNDLSSRESFGSMAYDDKELHDIINNLLKNGLIELTTIGNNSWKVLELTAKGREEIRNPILNKQTAKIFNEIKTIITEEDKKLFIAFKDFLNDYNEEQKKAIVNNKKHILCIAGAGSGKTTVLVKRIEFLIKYRTIEPSKILAITFTRKARQEMINRLEKIEGMQGVNVETFNSFCEKILIKYNNLVYQNDTRVITYKDKIIIINKALANLNINMKHAIDIYFTSAQRRSKTEEQLANIFLNDCFFVRDYFKYKNSEVEEGLLKKGSEPNIKLVFPVCRYIEAYMKKYGLRDFADQLIDTINLFQEHKELMPEFEHILIDEYQDINSVQIKLIDLLNGKNLFCVGDPRQSIFGWRGSDIKYILNFKEKYPDYENILLTKNYRSTKEIVKLINNSIKEMGLADLTSDIEGTKDIKLLKFDAEENEFEFVIQRILAANIPRNEVFVLARTNRQLNDLSQLMNSREIKHVLRSDEIRKTVTATEEDVTLATIHAIKGLESKMVFIIGCTTLNFPCKGSEHPIMEIINNDEYDKDDEEKRLFYVAMSRAKTNLYLTYSGKRHTNFITNTMLQTIDHIDLNKKKEKQTKLTWKESISSPDITSKLKNWRHEMSKEKNVPAYCIINDRTITELAEKMPSTKQDLNYIYGLGTSKIIRFGEEILKIVNS